jgi:hypothetical protein
VNQVTAIQEVRRYDGASAPDKTEEMIMRNIAPNAPYFPISASTAGRAAVWNRRLLFGAVFFILWAASMLALQAAGPEVRAMIAAEGMVVPSAE